MINLEVMSMWYYKRYQIKNVADVLEQNKKKVKVRSVYSLDGELIANENTDITRELPEHNDDPSLNRNVQYRVLGFRYENKNETIMVYSSVEAKTFCMLMRLSPI